MRFGGKLEKSHTVLFLLDNRFLLDCPPSPTPERAKHLRNRTVCADSFCHINGYHSFRKRSSRILEVQK
jgi:hypothetical protein